MKTIKLKKGTGIIKSHTLIALFLLAGIALTSCDNESECIYTNDLWIGRATVIHNGNSFSLQTDGGRNLSIVSNYADYTIPNEGQRAFVRYSLLDREEGTENYKANLYDIKNILTKNIIDLTPENDSQFGNDPVRIYHVWCAGGYLNINFGFNYGGTVTHAVNLVDNRTIEYPDNGKIYLEFRHNAFDDPEEVAHLGTVCFNLKQYEQKMGETVKFVIKFREFGADCSYEVTYDFQTDNTTPVGSENYIGKFGYE